MSDAEVITDPGEYVSDTERLKTLLTILEPLLTGVTTCTTGVTNPGRRLQNTASAFLSALEEEIEHRIQVMD